jgi:hypothetical protein
MSDCVNELSNTIFVNKQTTLPPGSLSMYTAYTDYFKEKLKFLMSSTQHVTVTTRPVMTLII